MGWVDALKIIDVKCSARTIATFVLICVLHYSVGKLGMVRSFEQSIQACSRTYQPDDTYTLPDLASYGLLFVNGFVGFVVLIVSRESNVIPYRIIKEV